MICYDVFSECARVCVCAVRRRSATEDLISGGVSADEDAGCSNRGYVAYGDVLSVSGDSRSEAEFSEFTGDDDDMQ